MSFRIDLHEPRNLSAGFFQSFSVAELAKEEHHAGRFPGNSILGIYLKG
jgi:hypothetical protein